MSSHATSAQAPDAGQVISAPMATDGVAPPLRVPIATGVPGVPVASTVWTNTLVPAT